MITVVQNLAKKVMIRNSRWPPCLYNWQWCLRGAIQDQYGPFVYSKDGNFLMIFLFSRNVCSFTEIKPFVFPNLQYCNYQKFKLI